MAAPLLTQLTGQVENKKTSLELLVLGTNWGFQGTVDAFCAKAKAVGYDGIEMWWPAKKEDQKTLFDALQKHELQIGFLTTGNSALFKEHIGSYKANLEAIISNHSQKPLYINCHSGKDHYSFEQNNQIVEVSIEKSTTSGIEILHETHRSRMCFAAHITRKFLEKNPQMGLTLDISHWCNVHESLLDDQTETVDLALQRTKHIHARVGHAEGPQVNDPRAPEWENTLKRHLFWWDEAIKYREKSGAKRMTFLTEFGPADYLPTLPYTRQPVANQWDINVFMMNLLKERYK